MNNSRKTRIFLFNFNVGSGIENLGNTFCKMLREYEQEGGNIDIMEYKLQNPPCILIDALVKYKPDIIILNETYTRTIKAVYYYKKCFPNTKAILINHTLSHLRNLPIKDEKANELLSHDEIVTTNYFMINMVDKIINLNCYPDRNRHNYPDWLRKKTVDILFPIDYRIFKKTKPFENRKIDFFYFGNVSNHRLSKEFLKLFDDLEHDMVLHVYGKLAGDEDYNRLILTSDKIIYHGYVKQENLVDTLNDCRFLINARAYGEPFFMSMGEAIMCGCIPMVVNDRKKKWSNWIDHYNGCYLEYQSNESLLSAMRKFNERRNDTELLKLLDKTSSENAEEMKGRTDYERFKNLLISIVEGKTNQNAKCSL